MYAKKGNVEVAKEFFNEHKTSILVLVTIVAIIATIHFSVGWTVLGLLALKFGLGVKIGTAKTFAAGVVKAGGKKALLFTTSGMLLKRHVIDLSTKFFTDHSVGKYKQNIVSVFKMKFEGIKNSSKIQRAKAIGVTLLGGPVLYLFWTKALGAVVQKVFYKALYPIFLFIWTFIINSLGFLGNAIGFIFQLVIINFVIDNLEKYWWGKAFLKGVTNIIRFFGDLFMYLNKVFIFLGFDVRMLMIRFSIKFNRWLEGILDKGLNKRQKLINRRNRHISTCKKINFKRKGRFKVREGKISSWKKMKGFMRTKVQKKLTWQEKREKRKNK